MVALMTPRHFIAVGQWYQYFGQTSDEEVTALLDEARAKYPSRASPRSNPQPA